ncbi:MAG: histidine kinase [Ilumatobacteraceae bacterium]
MRTGTTPLALGITGIWVVVWLVTQRIATPPLSTTPTLAFAFGACLLAVLGYGSVLRGRRSWGGTSTSARLDGELTESVLAAGRTLPYLRGGLTPDTASQVAELLLPLAGATGVALSDSDRVLGTAGVVPASPPVVDLGRFQRSPVVHDRVTGGAVHAVSVPLQVRSRTAGSMTVFHQGAARPSVERIEGLARLVSLHLELAELTQEAQLASDARLDALRAQINPHFLFNTLNTIASKSRTAPDEARHLLQRLADFFRYSIRQDGQLAEFANEYFFVRTYLALEQARYEERLDVNFDIDPQVLSVKIPVLMLQPLVENAVKHGIAPKTGGGRLTLKARVDSLGGAVRLSVRDDGVGMSEEVLQRLVNRNFDVRPTGGVGLANISERLEHLYGERYRLDIRSSAGKGTRIDLQVPLR